MSEKFDLLALGARVTSRGGDGLQGRSLVGLQRKLNTTQLGGRKAIPISLLRKIDFIPTLVFFDVSVYIYKFTMTCKTP